MINSFRLAALKKLEKPYLKISTDGFNLIFVNFDLSIIEDFTADYKEVKNFLEHFTVYKIEVKINHLIITLKTK